MLQQFNIKVEKTILIFDEGHNLQQQAESIGSSQISTYFLDQCIRQVKQLESKCKAKNENNSNTASSQKDRQEVANFLKNLRDFTSDPPENAHKIELKDKKTEN